MYFSLLAFHLPVFLNFHAYATPSKCKNKKHCIYFPPPLTLFSTFEQILLSGQSVLPSILYKSTKIAHVIQQICKTFMFFKVIYGNQIHVMNSKDVITYAKLEAFIKSVFKRLPAKYTLTYRDSDQDMICLLNDVDMKILFESGTTKVRVEIQECSEDFYDQTEEIVIEEEPVKKVEEVQELIPKIEDSVSTLERQEEAPSFISEVKSIDESINEKLNLLMPEIISKIKEQVISQSKIREAPKAEEVKVETKKVEEPTQKEKVPEVNSEVVHTHVTCDECLASPIVGVRYKCVVCADFDVCATCEAKTTHAHPFLKIKYPHQAPLKIFAIIDDPNESLEVNGERIPLQGLNQGINECISAFTGLFNNHIPEESKRTFSRCRENFRNFAHQFKEHHHKNRCRRGEKTEEKVEVPKTEPKIEQKVEVPKPEPKKEEKLNQPVIIEDKKEEKKEEKKPEVKPEVKPAQTQEDLMIEAANYISEVMGQSFNKSYRFVLSYPGLTKEEILMKFLNQ